MNGFDKNKDFMVLQKEYGFVPLYSSWNKYRIQYAKRIHNDIFAFLVLQNTKYNSNIGFVKLYIAKMQLPIDPIEKDPSMFQIDICTTKDIDWNEKHIDRITSLAEGKIILLMPFIDSIANKVEEFNNNFEFPEFGRFLFLKYEYETYKIFLNNRDEFQTVFNLIEESIKKKKRVTDALKELSLYEDKLRQILPNECCGYNFFSDEISKDSLYNNLIGYAYIDLITQSK